MIYAREELAKDIRSYWESFPGLVVVRMFCDAELLYLAEQYVMRVNDVMPVSIHWEIDNFPSYVMLFEGVGIELARRSGYATKEQMAAMDRAHDQAILDLKLGVGAEESYDFLDNPESWYPDIF